LLGGEKDGFGDGALVLEGDETGDEREVVAGLAGEEGDLGICAETNEQNSRGNSCKHLGNPYFF
jgi:hypothetical protein